MLADGGAEEGQKLPAHERPSGRIGVALFEVGLHLVAVVATELARQEPDEGGVDSRCQRPAGRHGRTFPIARVARAALTIASRRSVSAVMTWRPNSVSR